MSDAMKRDAPILFVFGLPSSIVDEWARARNVSRYSYRQIYQPEELQGLKGGTLILLGDWWKSEHAEYLLDIADKNQMEYVEVRTFE